jgi:hypothetical protein
MPYKTKKTVARNAPIEVLYGGQTISFKEFKKRNKLEKKRIELKKLLGE